MTNNSKVLLAAGILLILTIFFHLRLFAPLSLYTSQDFGRGDLTHFNYPFKDFYAQKLKSFELPLWTDLIGGGYPVFAEGQVGTFFLPNLILFFLLPTPWAFNLSFVITYLLSAFGVYFYCRFHKIGNLPSVFGALAFAFSMVFVSHTIHLNVIQTASLIPWVFLFGEKLVKNQTRLNFALLTLIVSQQIFIGFIQLVVYTFLGLLMLLGVQLYKERSIRKIAVLPGALVLGVLISSIQLLPTWELLHLAYDPSLGDGSRYVKWIQYPLTQLFSFLNPFAFGYPSLAKYAIDRRQGLFWENNGYLGLLPLFFAGFSVYSFIKKQNSLIKNHLISLGFWLLFALGWLFIIYSLPPISYFRVPQRSLFFINFSLSVLAAFGLDLFLVRFKHKLRWANVFILAVIIVSFFNLYLLLSPYNGVLPADKWLKEPPTVKFLKEKLDGNSRIYSVGFIENWKRVYYQVSGGWRSENAEKLLSTRANLDPNVNMIFNIPSADGYAGRLTKRAHFLKDNIEKGIFEEQNEIKIATSSAKILNLQGVKYLVSPKKVIAPGFTEASKYLDNLSQTTYLIYQNINYIGRIFPVSEIKLVVKDKVFEQLVEDQKFVPNKTVMVETPQFGNFSSEAKITDIKSSGSKLDFKVHTKGQAFLVITDSFYPGWVAKIDQEESKIIPVNINSRGLIVPPGDHQINFAYQPKSLRNGMILSLVSFLSLGLIMIFWKKLVKS